MEIYELLEKRIMNKATSEDYVQWAECLLMKGEDSEYVKIIAAFSLDERVYLCEIEGYFNRALLELNIQLQNKGEVLEEYSKVITNQIINDSIEPMKGVRKLCEIHVASNYSDKYSNWDCIEDEVSFLEDTGGTLTEIPLNKKNLNEYVKTEAELFLKLLKIDLPKDFFYKSICKNCQNFDRPKFERKRYKWLTDKWYRRLLLKWPQYQAICEKCGLNTLIKMSSHEGMQLYLDKCDE